MGAACGPSVDRSYAAVVNSSAVPGLAPDWFHVGGQILDAVSLNNGVFDGNASNARSLTQFKLKPTDRALNPGLPSAAEALAGTLAFNLLKCSVDTPFVESAWNYSSKILDSPETQSFPGTIQTYQYASGGNYDYQKAFAAVLGAVFLIDLFLLGYFVFHRRVLHDIFEPRALFSLAIGSPASVVLTESRPGKLTREQFNVRWGVDITERPPMIVARSGVDVAGVGAGFMRKRRVVGREVMDDEIPLRDRKGPAESGRYEEVAHDDRFHEY
jgi:hypothetical protein